MEEYSNTGGLFGEYFEEKHHRPFMIRWKSGKRVDPRLLVLIESFREIYVERSDFLKKIFPTSYDDFVAVFQKTGNAASSKNGEVRSLRAVGRSLSFGSQPETRPERFKVRPPNVVVTGEDDQTQSDDNDTKGSNG